MIGAIPSVTDQEHTPKPPIVSHTAPSSEEPRLLSDEPTMELVIRARSGDRLATEALLERCLPQLRRWAHGQLPVAARGSLDTNDLVQDAAMNLLKRLDFFQPQHV